MKSLLQMTFDCPEQSFSFLESRKGVLLHELGHYVAANIGGLVSGHIIIEDRDDCDCSGAFHIAPVSRQHLKFTPSRRKLTAAAGALAELHFCDKPILRRLGADIGMYFGGNVANQFMHGSNRGKAILLWKRLYLTVIEENADCISRNFDRCTTLLSEGRHVIRGFHVIPTSALIPPVQRSIMERIDDYFRTRARARALDDYLDMLSSDRPK